MRQNFSANYLIYHEESPEDDCPNDNIGEINRKIAEKLKTIQVKMLYCVYQNMEQNLAKEI